MKPKSKQKALTIAVFIVAAGLFGLFALFGPGGWLGGGLDSGKAVAGIDPGDEALVALGKTVYADNCASCHGAGGFGDGLAGKRLAIPPTNLRAFIAER
ncbi:MAG: hypothetical protein COB68_14080, partial [SAR202 cluster bacterium]